MKVFCVGAALIGSASAFAPGAGAFGVQRVSPSGPQMLADGSMPRRAAFAAILAMPAAANAMTVGICEHPPPLAPRDAARKAGC